MSDSYDDYETKIQLAEHAWEKRVVKTEHDRAVELGKAYERGWDAALAQQEPVAWISDSPTKGNGKQLHWTKSEAWRWSSNITPLYTAPPKKEWVWLTDEQVEDEWERITGHSIFGGDRSEQRAMYISPDEVIEFSRAIEAKLKERNG
jgi:hypothetical protein